MGSNGEESVTEVRGADGRSRYAIPDEIEPDRGQVSEYLSGKISRVPSWRLENKEIRDVLHEHVVGSKLANGSEHLSPQNGFGVSEALFLACSRDALAGEAAGDDIDGSSINCSELSDVLEDWNSRPALGEDVPAEGVGLTEEGVLESGEVQSEVECSVAAEEAADIHTAAFRTGQSRYSRSRMLRCSGC